MILRLCALGEEGAWRLAVKKPLSCLHRCQFLGAVLMVSAKMGESVAAFE